MNTLNYDLGYKASLEDNSDFSFILDADNVNISSSDLIELHMQNIKRRMIQFKHDRFAWETAAVAFCKSLDFMLLRIKKMMEYNLARRRKITGARLTGLTQKQLKAIELASKGFKNQHIALELGISVPAVSQILSRSYRILGVKSRYEAVIKCREHAWIQ